ncbi:succinyl-diaminopimelate desuccinylase [Corynebacterium yudongzhengii]|uniref:Succinyl-diaminopimelate desuccinylase n=1 Tax=Corynebacterium yudongzhengii TaxID=2080740 RepID=A0A2U1T9V2_9CORY|nr:succinyl-diaminopimelate desuccinylase [Corynebacterium yudongzhengii]AWB82164.1 succinyl-diaminopimelate desuccinylase [Corynebacterium yudongzhengii]PWC02668.1 succinyl-diaminopimelate desuccinylase [Corynebacterium yudongzhengii]
MSRLTLSKDPVALAADLIDIASPSHHEKALADAIEAGLRPLEKDGVEILRIDNTLLARTNRGFRERVILAGHIDTVPIADNVPHRLEGAGEDAILHGCGAVDMKTGLACYLHAFASLAGSTRLSRDLTLICYEGEEVASRFNGLGFVEKRAPEWLRGDVALLGEPSGRVIEAGCQGSIRLTLTAHGERAHSARAWLGDNAAHRLAGVMQRIDDYPPRTVTIDGCEYREGLNVVGLAAGVATNTLPDEARLTVNFRFAPDRLLEDAMGHLRQVLAVDDDPAFDVHVDDAVGGALPGLHAPAAEELVRAVAGEVRAKFGWTDVARFSSLNIPAVNFGPGDPGYAHKPGEQCPVSDITHVAGVLELYLTGEFSKQ